jgi:hypothetical protein
VEQAKAVILAELRLSLKKDFMEKVVSRKLQEVVETRQRKDEGSEKKGLKGLTFRKKEKKLPVVRAIEEPIPVVEASTERPKKKRKIASRKVIEEDIESEDEIDDAPASTDAARKRSPSEEPQELPAKKKQKVVLDAIKENVASGKLTGKKATKKAKTKQAKVKTAIEDPVLETIVPEYDYAPAVVAEIRPSPSPSLTSLSSRSPSPSPPPRSPVIQAQSLDQPLDPLQSGLCDDDEDLYFARMALALEDYGELPLPVDLPPPSDPDAPPPFRVHVTGSARTEGYYKISHAEKSAYVAQYASRQEATDSAAAEEAPQPQHVVSSRSNRANARRRAQGLEEINQVQRAMALSKGETTAAELTIKFNQLQTRKKHLRFARSPIHDWGLYAMERIARGEMVIEYVGEVIRAQVADKREKAYERQGIGSSYLFRIDEDLVVDATKKGNLGYVILRNSLCNRI